MEISYNRTHRESYMIIQDAFSISDYEERILKENEIRSLLSFHTMQTNGEMEIWYDISGKQSLRDYLEHEEITFETIEKMLMYSMLAIDEIHKYLIKQENILFCPDTIYVSRHEQFRMYFCYCPSQRTSSSAFSEVMEYVLSQVDHKMEDIMQLCYRLYDRSLCEETTLYELHKMVQSAMESSICQIEEAERIEAEEDSEEDVVKQQEIAEDTELYYQDRWEVVLQRIVKKGQQLMEMITGWRKKEGDERVHQDFFIEPEPEVIEKTQLLYQKKHECEGRLLYQGKQSELDYVVSKQVFRIGHGETGNDASLQSTAVSRNHAKISVEQGEYYIEDLNSTNGTYINGELLSYTQKQKLEYRDQIQFADVKYMFI